MCQRATGSVSIAFKNVQAGRCHAGSSEPDWYDSSPIAKRPYCRECGTSLGFQFKEGPNIDLTVASFDDPSRFKPNSHFGVESMHRAWLNTEGLPEIATDEHQLWSTNGSPRRARCRTESGWRERRFRPIADIRLTAAIRHFLPFIDVPAVPESCRLDRPSCRRRIMNGGA